MFHKIKYRLYFWIFLITVSLAVTTTGIVLYLNKKQSIEYSTLLISNILNQVRKNINYKIHDSNNITLRLYSNPSVLEAFSRDKNISLNLHDLDTSKIYGLFSEITRSNSDMLIQMIDFDREITGVDSKYNRFSSHRVTALIEEDKLLADPLYKELLDDPLSKFKMGFLQKETWVYSNNYIFILRMINRGFIKGERVTENYTEIIDTSDNVGVILCGVTVDSFLSIYNDSTLTDTGEIYLVDNRGLLLSTSDTSIDKDNKKGPVDIGYFIRDSELDDTGDRWIEINSVNYLLNYHKDHDFGFYIYTLQPEKSILEDFKLLKDITTITSIIRSVVIYAIAILIIGYFTRPIELLTFYMSKFINNRSGKDIEGEIIRQLKNRIKSQNEIGILSRTFETLLTTQKLLNREIVDREKSKAEAQNRSKNYLSTILNSIPSMIVSVDDKFIITQWNNMAENMCKQTAQTVSGRIVWDELPMLNRFKKDIVAIIDDSVKNLHFEAKNISWNNMYINISVSQLTSNFSRGAIIRIDDVTEKVRIGELLIQSEKMLSVGGLAAGMAHEINNPLGGMMQNSSVIHNRLIKNLSLPVNVKAAEDAGTNIEAIKSYMESRNIPKLLDNIQESGKTMRAIIKNMLSFSRKGGDITSTYHLEAILDKSIDMATSDINKDIEIFKHVDDDLPVIQCDAVKIQQVLLNIIINGSYAMSNAKTEKPCFNIVVRLSDDKKNVITEIEDNGPGMSEDVRKRIFEPFYTTKPVGLGTGLGLSVSYFIITENHRGELSVESFPGLGAKFIISLPITQVEY